MDGISRIEAGGFEVWCIEDGGLAFPNEDFPDVDDTNRADRLAAAGQDAIETAFNAYVIRHPDGRTDLVDTGCGALMGPVAGRLADRLALLGVAPESVGRVILTHLHGDHCGGAVRGGQLVFRAARYVMQSAEAAEFGGTDRPGGQLLRLAEGHVDLIDGDADLGDGLRAWSLPGHTPGHMGLRIGGSLVLVADIVHSEALQLPEPALCSVHDMDAAAARVSRTTALAEVAQEGLIWSGSHMLGPQKFARLSAHDGSYRREAL